VNEDGRGTSIWDTFSHTPGKVRNGDTGDVACDQYHRFEEDARLMAQLGVGAYRFSIAWTRIQPEGSGPPDPRGLDHYRRVIGALNENGVAAVPTLFHWDLPQALEDEGGWPARSTAERFAEYAAIVRDALAGEVRSWITINEPWVAAWLGYGEGIHAPGRRDTAAALAASHHLLLAHGLALQAFTSDDDVGITLNLEPHRPADLGDAEDERLARLGDGHMNRWFLDPLFGRGYPSDVVEHYAPISDLRFVRDGDLELVSGPTRSLGVNYYRPQYLASSPDRAGVTGPAVGELGAWYVVPPGTPVTAMRWPIDPGALTELLVRIRDDYAPARILVTENGAAFDDDVAEDGSVDDADRVAFLSEHVFAVRDAVEAGVPLEGFFVWSLLDNFEWAEGYSKRFGIVRVDLETQRRTPKASARWFSATLGAAGGQGSSPTGRVDRRGR
jgi:beta-glucosidase